MRNNFSNTLNELLAIIVVPIFIVLAIILVVPLLVILFISISIQWLIDKNKLRRLLRENNGKIYFIFADYNNYNFSEILKKKHPEINSIKVTRHYGNGILVDYLIKDRVSKCYPSLIKIDNKSLIVKEHYNSFKSLYKRENNIEAFLNLIEKSINNLKK